MLEVYNVIKDDVAPMVGAGSSGGGGSGASTSESAVVVSASGTAEEGDPGDLPDDLPPLV